MNTKKQKKQPSGKKANPTRGGWLLICGAFSACALTAVWIYYGQSKPEQEVAPPIPEVTVQVEQPFQEDPEDVSFDYISLKTPICHPSNPRQIIHHTGFSVSYNEGWRLPNWVAYEMTREKTVGGSERKNNFTKDPHVIGAIASADDYKYSGYDRGHMAPAADMKWDDIAMRESFYFSNICPQHPNLNQRGWKKLEDKIRHWAVADSAIIIVCGPLVNDSCRKLGANEVVIPHAFYKVILSPFLTTPQAIGFIFKNEQATEPLLSYVVTVDSVEVVTGIDFFSALPDGIENLIESVVDISRWDL